MTMEYEQWKEILSAIDNEADLSKDNVIEKVKEKLKVIDSSACEKWEKTNFDVNHLFQVGNIQCALLHLVAHDDLGNVAGALSKVEGIDVNAKETKVDGEELSTPLHKAAEFGSEKVIDVLLEVETIDVNARDCVEYTPLHWAAFYNKEKAVYALLKAEEINVNLVNKNGETPLHCAAQFNGREAISALLKAKDINVNAKNNRGKTPGDLAVNDEIKRLLRKAEEEQLSRRQNQSNLPENSADNSNNKNVILEKSTSAAKVDSSIEHTQPTSAATKGVFAGYVTVALSTAVAVALFVTGMVAVELMSIMIAVAAVTIAALAVGVTTYMLLKPSTKVDKTKVNGNAQAVLV